MIDLSVSLSSNGVVKVPGYEHLVRFGYTKNRGVYRLHVDATGEWEGLTIRAFWHVPDGKDPASSLVADGSVDVPASVTAQPGNGCITFEGSDGTKTVTSADLRYRVSANSGTEDGTEPEPGTPAWQQLVDAVHTDATAAEQAKTDAQTAAQQAGASAGAAATSAANAGQSAADALVWADAAKKSALAAGSNSQNAAQYAVEAKSYAEQAADSSSAAESSASAATGSQQAAESSAKKSEANANTAQESATLATGSASKAAQAQKSAETAADRAETAQQKTEEVRTDALDKISAAKADALKAVDAKEADATAAVERTQKKALDAVTAAQGTAVKAVSDAQSTATQAVQTAQTNAVSAVEKAGSEVLESIPEDYQTTVEKVEKLKTEKAEIDDTTVGPDAWSSKHIVDMLCPPLEETGNPVACYPVAGYPLGCKVSWEPTQEGSGSPSPDNVRPIKGRDSVTVERCGENLYNVNHFVGSYWVNDNYHKSNDFVNIHSSFWASYKMPCNVGDTINVSGFPELGGVSCVWTSDVSGEKYFKDAGSSLKVNASYAVPSGAQCLVLGVAGKLSVPDANYDNAMISIGASPTTYTPYIGQTTTLTLPRTIYGGEANAVSGEGKETWEAKSFDGTEKWLVFDAGGKGQFFYTTKYTIDKEPIESICSHFSTVRYTGTSIIRIYTNMFTDVDSWEAYLAAQYAAGTPVQVCYKLAEPVPFTATGAQPIPALSGVNTVLTDADSATVTGRADPIKRIIDLEDAVASMTTT